MEFAVDPVRNRRDHLGHFEVPVHHFLHRIVGRQLVDGVGVEHPALGRLSRAGPVQELGGLLDAGHPGIVRESRFARSKLQHLAVLVYIGSAFIGGGVEPRRHAFQLCAIFLGDGRASNCRGDQRRKHRQCETFHWASSRFFVTGEIIAQGPRD